MRASTSIVTLTLGAGLVTAFATPFAASLLAPYTTASATPAQATRPVMPRTVAYDANPRLMRKSDAEGGTLMFNSTMRGKYVAAPLLGTDVQIDVSGPIARTTLVQSFTNPTDEWVEGVYVFPLPETAAVDSLKMVVGDRLIEGTIKEKKEAKRIYEEAKTQGFTAALTEQERPNMFTNSVANIGPGETVTIRLTYQETVEMEADGFSLRFPMVVGPRYIPPAETVQMVDFGAEGGVVSGFASSVEDADRITPPVQHPSSGPINPVTLRVDLQPGFDVGSVSSTSHALDFTKDADGRYDITIDGEAFADRDFVLEWTPESGPTPSAGLFSETRADADYHLVMLTPSLDADALNLPRDVTFILDVSGSMAGESIRQAKAGLVHALEGLGEDDRFNIIAFDNETYPMWNALRDADTRNVDKALLWLDPMNGGGGTEMLPALRTALSQQRDDEGRLAQILFLTDGAIGNEDALFETIKEGRDDARVFTIGMGSAPNSHFMRHAAELGQGSFTYIGDVSEAANKMDALAAKLARPAMTDIQMTWPDGTVVEAWPDPVPDLYEGETLTVAARLPSGMSGTVLVTGQRGDVPWEAQLPIGNGASRKGVSKLWAREKIASLELEKLGNWARTDEIEEVILETALDHSLVTRLTSLVAVDVTPRRIDGQPLVSAAMPTNLPAGWEFAKIFGGVTLDRPSTDYGDLIAPGQDPSAPALERERIDVARGSTPAMLNMLLGLLLLMMAWMVGRARREA